MNEFDFESDLFTTELLCERCKHKHECPFATGKLGENDACEAYKILNQII